MMGKPVSLNGSSFSPTRLPLQHMRENLIHGPLYLSHTLPTYLQR